MIRVYLVDDHELVRTGFRLILAKEVDIEVVGEAGSGEDALAQIRRVKPDVVLCDLHLPGVSGLEVTERIVRGEWGPRVIIVSVQLDGPMPRRLLDAGASGYLLKDSPADKLADALRKVHRGGRAVDPELALDAWSEADPLSDRERQVLRLAGEGVAANDIAEQLGLSHGTVRNYLSEAIGKLGVENRIEAYRMARQKGWL